jgi:hypothetical protein
MEERPMKWMISSVAVLVAAVLSVAVTTAQSGGSMAKADAAGKMDKMEKSDAAYTGCLEAGSKTGAFTLTHVKPAADRMSGDAMKKDAMAPTTLTLTATSVDLSKHVGHTVSVTGSSSHGKMDAMEKDAMSGDAMGAPALAVKTLKMVSASCQM